MSYYARPIRMLGQFEGMSAFLPNVTALESVLMHKEAFLSCQIDGINVSVYDMLDASRKPDGNILHVKTMYPRAFRIG